MLLLRLVLFAATLFCGLSAAQAAQAAPIVEASNPSTNLTNPQASDNTTKGLITSPSFGHITLGPNGNWTETLAAISRLELFSYELPKTRSLTIHLLHNSDKGFPPDDFAPRLAKAVNSMLNLESASLEFLSGDTAETDFYNHLSQLPNLKHLTISSRADLALPNAPNLEYLDATQFHPPVFDTFLLDLGLYTHLTNLTLSWDMTLNSTHLSTMARSTPHLQSLTICGLEAIAEDVSLLSKFENLTRLELTDQDLIAFGWDPPDCGNYFFEPGCHSVVRSLDEQEGQAEEFAIRYLLREVTSLKEVKVGWTKTTEVMRHETGKIENVLFSRPEGDRGWYGLCHEDVGMVEQKPWYFFGWRV